jgi:hypothetical protein
MLKSKNNKLLMLAAAAAIIMPAAVSQSATTTMGATATFLSAISLSGVTNLAFSEITFVTPVAATDKVTITTAGTTTYAGNFAAGPTAAPAAGTVTISGGSNGAVVNVSCGTAAAAAVAVLTDGLGDKISADTIKIVDTANKAGGGSPCLGTGSTAFSYTLSAADLVLDVGGILEGSTANPAATFPGGNYSTANAGGTALTINVLYQ